MALAEIMFADRPAGRRTPKAAYEALKTLRSDSLGVEFTGADVRRRRQGEPALPPEMLGLIAALLILVGRVPDPRDRSAAAGLCAGLALLSCFGLVALLSHGMAVADWTPNLAALMVIGVGVDYALFIVTRHRRNLQRGMSVEDAIVSALNTSGRAVLFAGITVCIAILGLCALGRELPLRRRDRHLDRGCADDGRSDHAAAGAPVASSAVARCRGRSVRRSRRTGASSSCSA